MPHALRQDYIDFEDYLAGERDVEVRSEFVDGLVYAMAGASELHNTIAGTCYAAIENNLNDECRVWQSDMKLVGKNRNKNFAY